MVGLDHHRLLCSAWRTVAVLLFAGTVIGFSVHLSVCDEVVSSELVLHVGALR